MSRLLAITWIVLMCHVCVIGLVQKKSIALRSDINQYLANNSTIR